MAKIPNGALNPSEGALRTYLQALPHDGIDAFVVVRASLRYDVPGKSGLALETDNNIPVLWANYDIEIMDTTSFAMIGKAYSRVALRAGEQVGFAAVVASQAVLPDKDYNHTPEQMEVLRSIFGRLLSMSLVETLRVLELGIALPDVGDRLIVPMAQGENPFTNLKTVAIVSGLGDEFELRYFGSVFSKGESSTTVDWQVDKLVEEHARGLLAKRFQILDVPVDRTALVSARVLGPDNKLRESISELPSGQPVDAYIVFLRQPLPLLDLIATNMQGAGLA